MIRPPSLSRIWRNGARRGAAAIEFSLCLVFVFVPLMAAIFEWSWYFYQEVIVMRVARDAARVAVSDTVSDSARASVAQAWAEMRLTEMGFTVGASDVDVTYPGDTITAGAYDRDLLRIQISIPYNAIIGLLPNGGEPPETLSIVHEMRGGA